MLNQSLFFQNWRPTKTGGLLFQNKPDAIQSKTVLDELREQFVGLTSKLEALQESQREYVENYLRTPAEWDAEGEFPSRINSFLDMARRLYPGIVELSCYADGEIAYHWNTQSGGRPKIHAAYELAFQMAEIHVVGKGFIPDVSYDGESKCPSQDPNRPFCQAVEDVLADLGIVSGFIAPCNAAVRRLEADAMNQFYKLMEIRCHGARRLGKLGAKLFPDVATANKSGHS